MEIEQLLKQGREIWGNDKMTLPQIIVCLGKIFGDICRFERNAQKDAATHTDNDLKKELGNIIFSTIRWCDDLGYNPEDCINIAIDSQKKFQKN